MYCQDSGRKFRNYKVELADIRYAIITEYEADFFERALNERIDALTEDGYKIVGISYKPDVDIYNAVIEYTTPDKLYYEVENDSDEEVKEDDNLGNDN